MDQENLPFLPVYSSLTYPAVIVRIRSILEFVCFGVTKCYLVHHDLVGGGECCQDIAFTGQLAVSGKWNGFLYIFGNKVS